MILQKRKKVLKNFPILFLQLQNNDSSNSITSHAYERGSVCPSCCCMRTLDLLVLLPKFPAFPIVIVLLRLHLFRKGGAGGLCRGVEHIGRDLYRHLILERQHLGGCLAAKNHGGGKGEILHTACKIEIHNGQFISLHRDALLKLPGNVLMAGRQEIGRASCRDRREMW